MNDEINAGNVASRAPETPLRLLLYLLHRWFGIPLAMVGILVFYSGSIVVFAHELEHWTKRDAPFHAPVLTTSPAGPFSVAAAVEAIRASVPEDWRGAADISQSEGEPLSVFFHTHTTNPETGEEDALGAMVKVDPATGREVSRKEGYGHDIFEPDARGAATSFLVDLHVYLLLPETLGLVATGTVGFGLMVLLLTGVLVHRPTWKKSARSPRWAARPRVLGADVHTIVGVWTLPYTSILAFTGAWLSFGGALVFPLMSEVGFGGDEEALERVLSGPVEVAPGEGIADLDAILSDARTRGDDPTIRFVSLENWGADSPTATVYAVERPGWELDQYAWAYDGHTGAFLEEKANLGTTDSFGASLLAWTYVLHFGTLAGVWTKVLWAFCGLASCALAVAGLSVYVARQRDDSRSTRLVRGAAVALSAGLPFATASALLVWSSLAAFDRVATVPMMVAFAGALGVSLFLGAVFPLRRTVRGLLAAGGVGLLVMPLAGLAVTGVGPFDALADPHIAGTVGVDLTFVVLGVLLLIGAVRAREPAAAAA